MLRAHPPATAVALLLLFASAVGAQEPPDQPKPGRSAAELAVEDLKLRVTPPSLSLDVGATAQLKAEVVDVGGRPVEAGVLFFSRNRRALSVDRNGKVVARRPGSFEIVARVVIDGERGPTTVVPVTVVYPDPVAIELRGVPATIHVGTQVRIAAVVRDRNGGTRDDMKVRLTTTDDAIAQVDPFGNLLALAPGTVRVTGESAGLTGEAEVDVVANPVATVEVSTPVTTIRTGDVVTFEVVTRNGDGAVVDGVPVHLSFVAEPDDNLGNGATGQIEQSGRFVAETPGIYTIVATCGNAAGRAAIRATERFEQKRKLELVGHGPVLDTHTSDLWVWEGVDGRDYAVTGTWGANGDAHFWDVTDPANMERIATVSVDARTVNDVKVSEDGRLCVISREGASDRKNGLVVYDVSNPRQPTVASAFDDELTGGVHNVFIAENHIYALSAGRRYDVINIQDATAPVRVGSFQLFEPGASIHDVWVVDGIAYSSNWRYGLQLVDVGNGIKGGSPSHPVKIGSYAYPSGWNHAAFPFTSPQTGKFYVIGADEAFPFGLYTKDHPTYPRGWVHFVDFTDLDNPVEVARYEVPEAGTHNMWVDGTTLYVAYYNGGVRVVDISGDLMGDLYRQGREIAWYRPTHPEGVVPNAPMVWGPQPHKGVLFFSDWNSGLWACRLVPDTGRR